MLISLPELIQRTTGHVATVDALTARREIKVHGGTLIDVREPQEVATKAALGTHAIPRGILEMKISELCSDENSIIYLHCASGGRARLAASQLMAMGYKNVYAISCNVDDICMAFTDA